ncbi:MAG: hypothetical protein K0U40_03910 [Betaproteobacteria bacterium]|nr:hypothetical protein [Betaproteobacteria bacterium]
MNDKYRPMAVEIVEVIRRSEQGKTLPFICRGSDSNTYFVKGKYAGRRSQICEWIAGRLAMLIGLPIAPFTFVEVPEELLDIDFGLELKDLGAGLAFGSQQNRKVTELTFTGIKQVPDHLQQDVLVFDWWVRNADRSLGESGGNPNLFWEPGKEELVVIDHNLAFDYSINREKLIDNHIFRNQLQQLSGDFYRRSEYNEKLTKALQAWPQILKEIPQSWWYFDDEMTVPVDFDVDRAYALLKEFKHDDFWIWK